MLLFMLLVSVVISGIVPSPCPLHLSFCPLQLSPCPLQSVFLLFAFVILSIADSSSLSPLLFVGICKGYPSSAYPIFCKSHCILTIFTLYCLVRSHGTLGLFLSSIQPASTKSLILRLIVLSDFVIIISSAKSSIFLYIHPLRFSIITSSPPIAMRSFSSSINLSKSFILSDQYMN